MSDPKILAILKAVAARLDVIDGDGLYHTRLGQLVVRGKPVFSDDQLPACACYLTPRTIEDERGDRAKVAAQVVIEAHALIADNHPEDVATQMLADICRAVELQNDPRLGGLITERISFAADEIIYPEESGGVVSVSVSYDIPHIRHYGDPES
jgi:hypothetical protein